MGWKVFQTTVFVAVLFANVHEKWTPNGYLAAAFGVMAAWLATVLLGGLLKLAGKLRTRRETIQKNVSQPWRSIGQNR